MIGPSVGTEFHPVVVVVVAGAVVVEDETVGESFESSATIDDVPIHSAAAGSVPIRWMHSAG